MGSFPGGRDDAEQNITKQKLGPESKTSGQCWVVDKKVIENTKTVNVRYSESCVCPVSERGVTIVAIRNIVAAVTGDPKGEELVSKFIIPKTAKHQCSYAAILPQNQRGTVNVFVSHAWIYPFKLLVSALEEFERTNNTIERPFRYFLDYCAINQHSPDADLLNLNSCIQSCKVTVLVLSPWSDPIPLKRSWCIYEIMHTIISKKTELVVVLPPNEIQELRRSRLTTVADVLSKIDSAKAEASVEKDQKIIQKAIMDLGGFMKVNDTVLSELRKWLDSTVEKILQNWSDSKNGAGKRTFLNNAALYFRRRARYDRAITLNRELVKLDETDNSKTTRRMLISKKNLATALRSYAETIIHEEKTTDWMALILEAKSIYEQCIELNDKYLTPKESLKGNLQSQLAGVYELMGNLEKAETVCRAAVEEFKNYPPNHPNRLVCLCSLAQILAKREKFDEAGHWYEDGLRGLRSRLGPRHMWTLNGEFSYGCFLLLVAKRDKNINRDSIAKAVSMIQVCRDGMIETLGVNHPKTKRCSKILEVIEHESIDKETVFHFLSRASSTSRNLPIQLD